MNLQAVIVGDAVVGVEVNAAQAGQVRDAGAKLIHVVGVERGQMFAPGSHIGNIQNIVRAKCALHLNVPLMNHADLIVLADGNHAGAGGRVHGIEVGVATCRKRRGHRGGGGVTRAVVVVASVGRGLVKLAGEGDAVSVAGHVAVAAAKRSLLAELVVDTAVVWVVEDAVAAAEHRLAIAGQIVGKAHARTKVAIDLSNDAPGIPVLSGKHHRAGVDIKGGLLVVCFIWMGEEIPAHAQIQG